MQVGWPLLAKVGLLWHPSQGNLLTGFLRWLLACSTIESKSWRLTGCLLQANSEHIGICCPSLEFLYYWEHIAQLERIQKTALHVILGEEYRSYNQALKQCGLVKLSDRRKKLCVTFANKALKHTKFSKWFKPKGTHPNTRQEQPAFHSVYRKHDRFEKSPISYLTELLNKQFSKWEGGK